MKLKFIIPTKPEPVYKASVHKTGRIGFTIETANKFGIGVDKCMKLAVNEEDREIKNIYGVLGKAGEPEGYRIQKAGKYHSVDSKAFFDSLNLIYEGGDISFTVSEEDINGTRFLKFKSSEIIRQNLPF